MKDILKGSALVFVFKLVGALSLFCVHLIIARYYGASTLGVFNLILALLSIGVTFSLLGLDVYVVRMLPELGDDKLQVAGFLQKVIKLLFISSFICMVLFFSLSNIINMYLFKSYDASSYLSMLAIVMVPFTFFSVIPEVFRGLQDVKMYSFFKNALKYLVILIVISLSVFVLKNNIDPVFILYVVLVVLTVFMSVKLFYFLKYKNINVLKKQSYPREIIKYSYPLLFTSSMILLMGNVDSFMISYYLNEEQVGIYSACLKLSLLITFTLGSINGYIAPEIAKSFYDGNHKELKRIYFNSIKLITFISIPIFIVLFLFPGFFLGLFGEEFKSASGTLFVINLAFVVNALFGPVGYMLGMTNNQYLFMKIIFLGLIVNVVFNYLLVPKLEIFGAAIATLISMIFWNLRSFVALKQLKLI